jgi:septum formation protein
LTGPVVLLASASPRRRELLAQIGVPCRVTAADLDETPRAGESAADLALRLAREKAIVGFLRDGGRCPTLGADTVVVVDGVPHGKPRDAQDAAAMLLRLGGRSHDVLSAVAVAWGPPDAPRVEARLCASRVTMRVITPAEAAAYAATGEPLDKAGAYAVQGRGAVFIRELSGSYSGVMGLPLYETAELLELAGAAPSWRAGP